MASNHPLTRRGLLTAGLGATAGIAAGSTAARATGIKADPFTLGVASGDPSPSGMVLWTRLALDPIAEDGLGGMPDRTIEVQWQLAADERFSSILQEGTEAAAAEYAHSVHVEVEGLQPGAEYWYRFRTEGYVSPVGRTRTAPAADATTPLTLGVTSCAQWEHGFFTAYRRIAQEQPDIILSLGDYIYEHGPGGYPVTPRARTMVGSEIRTLADYRRRHAFYKTDPDLQHAHATAPWLVVFDDHEVDNNWAGMRHEVGGEVASFARRREAAFRAYWENMPLRRAALPEGPDMTLYRRITWGQVANLHMLDTRQYRSNQPCGGLIGPCAGAESASQTMLGATQEAWLTESLRDSQQVWDILGQQVMFAQYDMDPGPGFTTNVDAWDGYLAAKSRMMDLWENLQVKNPVVLTGDYHESFAFDLEREMDGQLKQVGSEFVVTSVTSGGDGSGEVAFEDSQNPHLRFHDPRRGYLTMRFEMDSMKADFRRIDRVSQPGGTARAVGTFTLDAGQKGLIQAS